MREPWLAIATCSQEQATPRRRGGCAREQSQREQGCFQQLLLLQLRGCSAQDVRRRRCSWVYPGAEPTVAQQAVQEALGE